MRDKRRIRLTYANVVASLALFAALGGSSYAALSITGKQVRDGSLSGRDVHDASLTGRDVRDRSLMAQDFKAGQLAAGTQGPKGEPGAPGLVGPKGDPGATGSPGLSGVEKVVATVVNNSPTRREVLFPECPDGKRVIAAGGSVATAQADEGKVILTQAFPLSINHAQVVAEEVAGTNPASWQLIGYATCANVQ